MKKIKKLAKSIEDALLETPWIYNATTKFHAYLTKVLNAKELFHLRREINAEINAWNLTEVSEKQKAIVRSIMETVLDGYIKNVIASSEKSERPSVKMLARLNLAVAKAIATRLSNIIAVQPMKSPVSLLYSLQYKGGEKQEEGTNTKLSLEIVSQAIEAASRRLQTSWTMEAAQDLRAIHGLDIEAEFLKAAGNEIAGEITNEILSDLMRLGTEIDIREMGLVKRAATGIDLEANKALVIEIRKAASNIAHRTRRGAGNFIVVSPYVVPLLQALPQGWFTPSLTPSGGFLGNELLYAGDLGTIKVFMSMQAGDNILVGYKGTNSEVDAGFYFSPYIPVVSAGVVMNPKTFQPVMTLLTRYGKAPNKNQETAQNYYRVIKLDGVDPDPDPEQAL